MAGVVLSYAVTYDDDRTENVDADQRDFAELEIQDWYDPEKRQVNRVARFLAWHALKRRGRTDLSWPKWSAGVMQVEDRAPDEEDEQGRPPASPPRGRRAATGGS